jgi:hypothetical protein
MYILFGDLSGFGDDGIIDFFWWLIRLDFNALIGTAWVWFIVTAAVCWFICYTLSCRNYQAGTEQ